MKKVFLSMFVLCVAGLSVSAQSGAKPKAKPAAKSPAPVMKNLLDSFSYAAGVNVATNMKAQGITSLNAAAMQKGIDDVFKNNKQLLTPEVNNSCMQRQLDIFSAAKDAVAIEKGKAFLANNKKGKGVITLPDGLQYEIIKSGDVTGTQPKLVDTVEVNYLVGTIDGTEVENSFKSGQPAAFPLGGVIKGWVEILQMMRPGDHWKVVVPSELAYGAAGNGAAIPPNSVLVFEIRLEKVRPAVEAPKNN
ncbi:MAG: FKBP-type peptidyl-prolyl cis-trans isomerase [Chitinophagaceae bacterium]|nr:FKBP-type peptidyl-prolyl cis-trans isomerase [Chitinophagaceae bacterium]